MIYTVRVKKNAKNLRVYSVPKKIGARDNFITRMLMKLIAGKKNDTGQI